MATATIRANSIRGERRRLLCCEGGFFLRAHRSKEKANYPISECYAGKPSSIHRRVLQPRSTPLVVRLPEPG
jgi:hypothetical protein